MQSNESSHGFYGSLRQVGGFSLLEVLIALVILSVGLLGIAAMMSTTLKANDSAYMRTQATELAYNMLDRMRANRSAALGGSYNIALAATVANPPNCTGSGTVHPGCTPDQLAQFDLAQWKQDLAATLPGGDGSVGTSISGGATVATITVQWTDTRAQTTLKETTNPNAVFNLTISSAL